MARYRLMTSILESQILAKLAKFCDIYFSKYHFLYNITHYTYTVKHIIWKDKEFILLTLNY